MNSLTQQPWFYWALGVVVGLPLALVALTEWQSLLKRRGSALARSVDMLRWIVVPSVALIILLTKTSDISSRTSGVRIVSTVLGLVLLLLALSLLNFVIFSNAAKGTWRERLPSIFIDIARLIIIGIGLAVLFSLVWGTNVGGLFAALGVTSIVLGLSLQGAIGSIVSGLLLLFEQPFTIGDWLEIGSTAGRVVEVNWRSVHIDTGSSIEIIPNASLAGSSFRNLSRPVATHAIAVTMAFGLQDSPDRVSELLNALAMDLPQRAQGHTASTSHSGPKTFTTSLTVVTPAEAGAAEATLRSWAWYASRRAGLHLDGSEPGFGDAGEVEGHLRGHAAMLHVDQAEIADLAPALSVERYGSGETVQRVGQVPSALRLLVAGRVAIEVPLADGNALPAGAIDVGEFIGQTALTREPVRMFVKAQVEATFLVIPREVIDAMVHSRPQLARDLGKIMDQRRQRANAALERAHGLLPRSEISAA